MKRHIAALLLLAMALLPSGAGAADADRRMGNPVNDLTGRLWRESPQDVRVAFIYGVRTAIAVEHLVNGMITERAAKEGRKPVSTLSPFERRWSAAFRDSSPQEIVAATDAWYDAHPEGLDRPVMEVIWYELIVPRTADGKARGTEKATSATTR